MIISLFELVTICNLFAIHQNNTSMLQSEFYDRTHIKLSGDEYADVENIYNNVKMQKDAFCQHWVEEKENPLFKELAEAFCKQTKELLQAQSDLGTIENKYKSEIEAIKKENERILSDKEETHKSLGRKIIENIDDEVKLHDILEEEFTLDFIIKVKLYNDMELERSERDYLIGKL